MSFSEKTYRHLNNELGFTPQGDDDAQTFYDIKKDLISVFFMKSGDGTSPMFGYWVDKNVPQKYYQIMTETLQECTAGNNCGRVIEEEELIYCVIKDESAMSVNEFDKIISIMIDKAKVKVSNIQGSSDELEKAVKQANNEDKLIATHAQIRKTVIWACIGWPIVVFGFAGNLLFVLLGSAVFAAPLLWIMFKGGGLKDVFKHDDYEVVTTYNDGSKKSDGGSESLLMWLIQVVIGGLLVVFLGVLITLGILIWACIRYSILYVKSAMKPAFLHSGFLWMSIGFGVLVIAPVIINLIV